MYKSADHRLVEACAWRPDEPATPINDHIVVSPGTSNSYLVASSEGDVVVNTGTSYQGARHRERYETLLGRELQVHTIVFTQSHPDHIGGWEALNGPATVTVAQEGFADCRLDRTLLTDYFPRRSRVMVGDLQPAERRQQWLHTPVEPVLTTTFAKTHRFVLGGRRFELHATPGGETLDSCVVWLPDEGTVFIGNLMGALLDALPALYTPRGDRLRSARQFIRSVDAVLALEPELLIAGHEEPIAGHEEIARRVGKVRDAVAYIHDETVAGMNAGKSLFTLMSEIELPASLRTRPGRGPVRWYVRAVWEEYSGWFRFESTTELYAVPQAALWDEMTEAMGGADAVASHAEAHVNAGEPVKALHFTDMALSVDPGHRRAREVQIAALSQLLEQSGGWAHDELRWLESELDTARRAI
jgi:alkyl sulfatase BDS1-like metallo-beta-lactamase superfamily hydrolase